MAEIGPCGRKMVGRCGPRCSAWLGVEDRLVKVKLFVHDKSAFRGWGRSLARLEDEVNAWLAVNSRIKIVHVTQSSNGGSFDTSKVFVSIWYEEGEGLGDPADRPHDERFSGR